MRTKPPPCRSASVIVSILLASILPAGAAAARHFSPASSAFAAALHMSASQNTKMQRLVLVGGGHGHVQVIKALNRLSRPPSVSVTLIDPQESASYSGMVPGCVSKLYTPEQTLIHLRPLAAWADIEYIKRSVVDVDPAQRKIYLDGGVQGDSSSQDCIDYDAVSFDIGSATRGLDETPGAAERTIPTRPISDLVRRIAEEEAALKSKIDGGEWTRGGAHVVVVGGGAAGIELSMAMRARWSYLFQGGSSNKLEVTLLDSGSELLPAETLACRQALRDTLSERDIVVKHGATVRSIEPNEIILKNGENLPYTHCIWATGANRHPLADKLRDRGIAVSDRGWIRVSPTLQSVSHAKIFAAGDCCTIEGLSDDRPSPPKAGVYAVRSGPVLIKNLTGFLVGKPEESFTRYNPQSDFLKLVMAGDGTALGFRFGIPLRGKWVWELKDTIDQMFMNLFKAENLPKLEEVKEGELDTSQYDAVDQNKPNLDPKEAAALLLRTDDDVDYQQAWGVLRSMMQDEEYKGKVLNSVKI